MAGKSGRQQWHGGVRTLAGDVWARLKRDRTALACLVVIVVYCLMASWGEWVYWSARVQDVVPIYQVQDFGHRYEPPSGAHWLGTDALGRDVFHRTIQGARIAFRVGIITSLLALPIAMVLGGAAGYFGGRWDECVVWLYSTVASIPSLLLILVIASVVGHGLIGVYLGIGLTTWVGLCRLLRAEFLKHRQLQYVEAARSLGAGHARIIIRHILPNLFHLVIINFSLRFGNAVGTEVILSFLGVGAEGEPSWGIMISDARLRLWQGVWWELAASIGATFFIVLAFNVFGDALRDAMDPRLRMVEGS